MDTHFHQSLVADGRVYADQSFSLYGSIVSTQVLEIWTLQWLCTPTKEREVINRRQSFGRASMNAISIVWNYLGHRIECPPEKLMLLSFSVPKTSVWDAKTTGIERILVEKPESATKLPWGRFTLIAQNFFRKVNTTDDDAYILFKDPQAHPALSKFPYGCVSMKKFLIGITINARNAQDGRPKPDISDRELNALFTEIYRIKGLFADCFHANGTSKGDSSF
ncbi:hypothetical protein IW261DRAFT_1616188 [Armillaria novae-zelandiae]|uniref:Uncharacterized protein n=1 Tax=Armillaria novae-zelandiae TaxID=153914 RepID=A0AA39UNB3_9AGAR|nr:hypothetical protein IW261DRAFT_1616188 [Armillaria novae-zelandiae]